MNDPSMIVMGIVWGGLFVYLLVPFYVKTETHSKMTFVEALKDSFIKITFHKKALLALLLLVITLSVNWWSQAQDVIYNEMHGINAPTQSVNNLVIIIVYALIIYLLVIGRRSIKSML